MFEERITLRCHKLDLFLLIVCINCEMTLKNGDVKFNFGVTVLGIGNSHSELYYRSSFLLHAAGETVLVDCPDPIQKMFKELKIYPILI